jgi:DNA repair exonuclease SbcCD nuclease subunit
MIPGNHDCYYKEKADINSLSMFSGWQNICVFDKVQEIYIGNKHACMVPWGFDVADIPKCDLIFGHFEIQTFKMNSFRVCEHGFNIRDLLHKAPKIISGHFHFRDDRVFENGTIKYVGNPFQTDLNDSCNTKGFYVYDSQLNDFEFYENTCSPLIYKLQLSNLVAKGVDALQLKNLCKSNIIRFIIDKVVSTEDADFLATKINSFKPLQLSVDYNNAASMPALDDRKDLSGVDVEQAIADFVAMLDVENKQEITQYCLLLYKKYK